MPQSGCSAARLQLNEFICVYVSIYVHNKVLLEVTNVTLLPAFYFDFLPFHGVCRCTYGFFDTYTQCRDLYGRNYLFLCEPAYLAAHKQQITCLI